MHTPDFDRPPSFMRRYAAAETTDPDTLIGLACDESYWVRRQAVQNAATPDWILDLLVRAGATPDLRGKGRPDPTLDADSLRSLVEGGPWARQLVAEHPNAPADVLDILRDQPSIPLRLAIAGNRNAAPDTIAALCADIEEPVRCAAVAHPECPTAIVDLLTAAGASADLQSASRPEESLEPDSLRFLAELGLWGRFLVARNPGCPIDLLEFIAVDADWRVRSGVLDNPNLPLELGSKQQGHQGADTLRKIQQLSAPEPPQDTLEALAHHPNAEVRMAVARHPAITPRLLSRMATDGAKEVRSFVIANPRIEPLVIDKLTRAGSSPDLMQLSVPDPTMAAAELDELSRQGLWARQLVVRHPNTSSDTVAHLICDSDPKIREWAAVHPNASQETIRSLIRAGSSTDYQGFAPHDPSQPAEELRELSELGPWAEWVVAANPNTPPDLLDILAQSEDWQVRQFVAQNPNTPQAVLARLAKDGVGERTYS